MEFSTGAPQGQGRYGANDETNYKTEATQPEQRFILLHNV
jgi:hypothetical protein